MRYVVIGDMHVKSTNLDESCRLIEWISTIRPDLDLVFMGDQLNDFGIARVECLDFWKKSLGLLRHNRSGKIIFLVGNHDKNHDGTHDFMSALFCDMQSEDVYIISEPKVLGDAIFLPFMRNGDNFLKTLNSLLVEKDLPVFCHQEFDGSFFENGFYAPHGVKPDQIIGTKSIVSGHIHVAQSVGERVFYVGVPRPLTKNDANNDKGVWLFDESLSHREFIKTPSEVAMSFRKMVITEDNFDIEKLKQEVENPDRLYVDIKGTSDFVKSVMKQVKMKGVKVATTFTDTVTFDHRVIKESDGISKAFGEYSMRYFDQTGLGSKEIKAVLNIIHKYCPGLTANT